MSPKRKSALMSLAVAIALGVIGFGVSWFSSILGAILVATGFFVSFRAVGTYNLFISRAGATVVGLLYSATVYVASKNLALAVSVLPAAFITMPGETAVRSLGYRAMWVIPVGMACIPAIAAVGAWPPDRSWLLLLPLSVVLAFITFVGVRVERKVARNRMPNWKIQIGDPAPEITLPRRDGTGEFRLSEHRGRFVYIHVTRGDWCAVCHVMMRLIKRDAPALKEQGALLVVVAPQSGEDAAAFAKELGLDFMILADPNHEVAKQFGAHDPRAYSGNGGPLPASFLIDPDGVVSWASRSDDVITFPDAHAPLEVIAAYNRQHATAA